MLTGGVAGTAIGGIRMSIAGMSGIRIEGTEILRVPIVPGTARLPIGFFSGVTVTVRVL
jgi:hypothetical protein